MAFELDTSLIGVVLMSVSNMCLTRDTSLIT